MPNINNTEKQVTDLVDQTVSRIDPCQDERTAWSPHQDAGWKFMSWMRTYLETTIPQYPGVDCRAPTISRLMDQKKIWLFWVFGLNRISNLNKSPWAWLSYCVSNYISIHFRPKNRLRFLTATTTACKIIPKIDLMHRAVSITFLDWVSKVDGSMLGKSFRATGSRNSMKGTMINTRKGRSLKTSAHVLRN